MICNKKGDKDTLFLFKKNIQFLKNILKERISHPSLALLFLLFISSIIINFVSCGVYSFTGASVPKHIKTITIPVAQDRSNSGEPGLGEQLTNMLIQKFIDDNTLQIVNKNNANSVLECTITSLTDAPAVVSAGENVTSRRVTIVVQAVYRDLVQRKTIFDKSFSNYGDYAASGSISERKNAIQTALDKITQDILLDTVSGW